LQNPKFLTVCLFGRITALTEKRFILPIMARFNFAFETAISDTFVCVTSSCKKADKSTKLLTRCARNYLKSGLVRFVSLCKKKSIRLLYREAESSCHITRQASINARALVQQPY